MRESKGGKTRARYVYTTTKVFAYLNLDSGGVHRVDGRRGGGGGVSRWGGGSPVKSRARQGSMRRVAVREREREGENQRRKLMCIYTHVELWGQSKNI